MDVVKHINLAHERILRELMPDTCHIIPNTGSGAVIVGGVKTSNAPVPRVYKLDENNDPVSLFPCRLDVSRAFRPDRLKEAVTVVDEYQLTLPRDTILLHSDRIVVFTTKNPGGVKYEIRKLKDRSNFDVTVVATIVEIETQYDKP